MFSLVGIESAGECRVPYPNVSKGTSRAYVASFAGTRATQPIEVAFLGEKGLCSTPLLNAAFRRAEWCFLPSKGAECGVHALQVALGGNERLPYVLQY